MNINKAATTSAQRYYRKLLKAEESFQKARKTLLEYAKQHPDSYENCSSVPEMYVAQEKLFRYVLPKEELQYIDNRFGLKGLVIECRKKYGKYGVTAVVKKIIQLPYFLKSNIEKDYAANNAGGKQMILDSARNILKKYEN